MTAATAVGRVLGPIDGGIAELHLPPIVLFGRGALARLGPEARGFGDRAMLVTDRGMAATGIVDQVVRVLRDSGVDPLIFDGVEPNPTIAQVEAGLEAGAGREIRVIVSVGGGSAHDCAKVIALVQRRKDLRLSGPEKLRMTAKLPAWQERARAVQDLLAQLAA